MAKFKDYLKDGTYGVMAYAVQRWENQEGFAKVTKLMYGKGYSVDVNNKYDLHFKNEKELKKWLKKEKYELMGYDKAF
jgi:hypothetical protein